MLGELFYNIGARTKPLEDSLKSSVKEMNNADKAMQGTAKSIEGGTKKMADGAGANIGVMQQNLSSLGPAGQMASTGMAKASMAAKILNVALGPIGLILGAIGLAVKALTSYFKGSEEGQMRMAKIMGYLQGVGVVLKDMFHDLGKMLVWAFDNPKQAVINLWNTIQNAFVKRFVALKDMVTGTWTVIAKGAEGVGLAIAGIFSEEKRKKSKQAFAEMRQGMKDVANASLDLVSGTVDGIKRIAEFGKKANDVGKAMAKLNERELALRMRIADESVDIARLERDIAILRKTANDSSYELTEQITAQRLAMEEIERKFDIQIGQAKEALEIQKERMEQGHNEVEDREKLKQLEADLLNLEGARAAEQRSLLRRLDTLLNQERALAAEKANAAKEQQQAQLDAIGAEFDAREKILANIDDHYKQESDKLHDQLNEKINAHKWSEEERLKITQYYAERIAEAEKDENERRLEENKKLVGAIEAVWLGAGDSMIGLFASIGAGIADNSQTSREATKNMLKDINALITGLVIQSIMASAMPLFGKLALAATAGAISSGLMNQIPKMAQGGIVPRGYPNDSYPAMLSSGEMVVPPNKLPSNMGGGTLTARVSRGDLLFILEQGKDRFENNF
jgi:hypothetical protein